MITAVGCDVEEISRFENKKDAFLKRIYTPAELDYCLSKKFPAKHLAVRYCAKEAVVKALFSLGIKNVFYADIDVVRAENGVPSIKLLKNIETNIDFSVSLSHSKTTAMAVVFACIGK